MAVVVSQMAAVQLPIFLARILSPSFVLLAGLTLFFTKPRPLRLQSEITPVVVASSIPRRAVILLLLTLVAFSYLFDGLAFVVFAVLDHDWPRQTGIPINTITGLIAFSGLAALGTWKDIHGVDVWLLRRIKFAVLLSLALDISLSTLLASRLREKDPCKFHTFIETSMIRKIFISSAHVFSIRSLVHIALPAFRVLLLLPLLAALASPRVVYSSAETYPNVEEPAPTVSSFLLPHDAVPQSSTGLNGESSKYGTFRVTRPNLQASAPVTRAATPVPSSGPDVKVTACRLLLDFKLRFLLRSTRNPKYHTTHPGPNYGGVCASLHRICGQRTLLVCNS